MTPTLLGNRTLAAGTPVTAASTAAGPAPSDRGRPASTTRHMRRRHRVNWDNPARVFGRRVRISVVGPPEIAIGLKRIDPFRYINADAMPLARRHMPPGFTIPFMDIRELQVRGGVCVCVCACV